MGQKRFYCVIAQKRAGLSQGRVALVADTVPPKMFLFVGFLLPDKRPRNSGTWIPHATPGRLIRGDSSPPQFSECRKRGVGKTGGHFMAVLAVCSEFFLKSLGLVLIILGCFGGCERFVFPMTNFLTPVQLLPSMIATGLLWYLW